MGYEERERDEKFFIPYYHLSKGSMKKVLVACDEPYCTNVNEVSYYDYLRLHKDYYNCKYHSQSYYQLKAKELGFSLQSEYINSSSYLKLLCLKCGTPQERKWSQVIRSGCTTCYYDSQKLTIEYIRDEFKKVGYDLQTKIFTDYKKQKLYYFCDKGHYTYIVWNDFQQGCRCSECARERMRGDTSPRWNPNLTDEERLKKRASYEYTLWRMAVFHRDDFRCKCCGCNRGKDFNAHHIVNFTGNKDLQLDVNNGITLCEECHEDFHWTYGYENNDLSQLAEYVEDFWINLYKEKEEGMSPLQD